ncbi:anti-sigma factor family protein [Streptomyces beijiangensis]|uniref:Zf-HC2 domain-containing protein n=1 Tax=Streptomyces beijiangensis TaxID=163361 RepID=A0A939FC41_9ACTN|nr:zf-HC2 domain-containing protein [Streptomyces beijiangensis]MBO0515887.1 zf-HC2 domain-containing protein [Streptomyces beijiangensis]
MSGSGPTPAEQHLGDRLAALVDGELNHDVRERVLSHLASCAKCKAEADAQRRLKSVFADTAPPPPSEGLLARLQGLPGGPGGDDTGRGGSGPFGGGRLAGGVYGLTGSSREFPQDPGETFGYVPVRPHGSAPATGFPIHPVGRQDTDRSVSSSRRRFAFAAAGAVSLAAIALGGTMPTGASGDATAATAQGGGSAAPQGASSQAVVAGTEILRRQGGASSALTGDKIGPSATATNTPPVTALSAPAVSPLLTAGIVRTALSHPLSAALLTGSSLPPLIPAIAPATASVPPATPSPTATPAATQLAGAPQLTRH